MGKIKVIRAGLFSTIQDLGRFGFRKFGVPVSGVMDQSSAKIANALVMNSSKTPVLEITMAGPQLEFDCNCLIAICGADISPRLDEQPIENNRPVFVEAGQSLEFGKLKTGCRAYVAVAGGFQVDKVLGSHSWYEGVTTKGQLKKDDELKVHEFNEVPEPPNSSVAANDFTEEGLEVYPGPEFEELSATSRENLSKKKFTITEQASRMGYRLEEKLKAAKQSGEMLTSAVRPGTVQLMPNGQLIILTRDCQTTGGYPRVLQLTEAALNLLAQKKPGERVAFSLAWGN